MCMVTTVLYSLTFRLRLTLTVIDLLLCMRTTYSRTCAKCDAHATRGSLRRYRYTSFPCLDLSFFPNIRLPFLPPFFFLKKNKNKIKFLYLSNVTSFPNFTIFLLFSFKFFFVFLFFFFLFSLKLIVYLFNGNSIKWLMTYNV